MAPLYLSIRRLILVLLFVQSASFYKIYASDDNPSNSVSDLLLSSLNDNFDRSSLLDNIDSENENLIINNDNEYALNNWLSLLNEENTLNKRSFFSSGIHSYKSHPQRRNNRPHWNPLVAAYRRCGELSRREERELCFKDAIQMLFVHKLRK